MSFKVALILKKHSDLSSARSEWYIKVQILVVFDGARAAEIGLLCRYRAYHTYVTDKFCACAEDIRNRY